MSFPTSSPAHSCERDWRASAASAGHRRLCHILFSFLLSSCFVLTYSLKGNLDGKKNNVLRATIDCAQLHKLLNIRRCFPVFPICNGGYVNTHQICNSSLCFICIYSCRSQRYLKHAITLLRAAAGMFLYPSVLRAFAFLPSRSFR